ncbi:ECF transporter S component [uncultured Clostridium sp.]|uniref:ECF transporter S component n=1 Tax=uncultured Clostridium sp. TaxID=59620 RepID=UPI00260864F0|nr:ECF transporter S component [uncultured Clostridium sp.]
METKTSRRRLTSRQLVVIGMLSGITIFMGLTGIGFIPIPPVKLTIMGVPVIIGAILEGPLVGGLVGLVFGLFGMYQAIAAPFPTSPLFLNPITSLVPRILIGVITYYVYRALRNRFKKESVAIGISAIVGSLVNTVGVLGCIYIFGLNQYASLLHISKNSVLGALGIIAGTNGIPEAIICTVITIPVVLAVMKIKKRR